MTEKEKDDIESLQLVFDNIQKLDNFEKNE